jgi:hypothetical protein
MAAEHVRVLRAALAVLVAKRRSIATTLSQSYSDQACDQIAIVQSSIDAIERAIVQEQKEVSS